MATSVNHAHSEQKLGIQNGDCTSLTCKRRKISAVRDFPEGCSPFASRIDPDFADGAIIENKNGEHSAGDAVRTSKCDGDLHHSQVKDDFILADTLGQTIDSSLKNENPELSSHHVDGPPIENDKSAEILLVGMEASKDIGLTRIADGPPLANDESAKGLSVAMESSEDTGFRTTENSMKCQSFGVSKLSSPVAEVVFSGGSKSLSNANIAGSSACIEKPVALRYFPRRKVSAFRDFPSLCGPSAPLLSEDERLNEILSLDNKRVGQENLAVDENILKKVAATDVEEEGNEIQDENACKGKLADIVKPDSERNVSEKVKKRGLFEPSSGMKLEQENTIEKYITVPQESNHQQVGINSKTVVKEENGDAIQIEGTSGLETVVHPEIQSPDATPLDMSICRHELEGDFNGLQFTSAKKLVLGLMSTSECPWRSDKGSSKLKLIGGTNETKGKKVGFFARLDRSKGAVKSRESPNRFGQKLLKKKKGNAASDGMGQLVIWEKEDSLDLDENIEHSEVVPKSHAFNVNVPPFGQCSFGGHDNDSNVTRNKVRETLRLFQAVSRKLLQEVESKFNDGANNRRRVDLQAAKILREKGKYVNFGKHILGPVPGVEVGDEFQYRVELNIIGLHRQLQGGIDYVRHNGKILATSIVASGGYADELDNSDVLIYTGQGGNVMSSDKEPEDQKLERGNLALKNSSEEKNCVRVIRGSESMDGKCKTYVYDGLYIVESFWQDMGPHGKLVYRFRLQRIQGQPELALKEVKRSKKFKTREGLCVDDISHGKERIPICTVNTIDDEKPPPFKYITSMIYPDCNLIPPEGCDCTNGCSDMKKCSCVVKNGGEIPFNHNGAIVEAKPLVYECGPSCKCPSTCHNRVSQLGIKFQLEIFKTNTTGWGVRSLNSIPSGSFICEYIGELLEEKEAEQRTGNDEYLFDIGNNNSSSALWDGLSTLIPDTQSSSCEVVKDGGFTIDAAEYGNVGRFINHSCSPNLYAQNVLYDHHDNRIPHIMFFAAENIPPLQELTYDYNYMIDQVHDSDGNIKKKDCHCGSVECTGRMY